MATQKTRISPFLLALLASSTLLLSACGDDDNAPSTAATASATGGGSIAATPVRNNTSSSLLFAGINLVDADGAPSGQQIVLVDPATGSVVRQIPVDEQSMHLAAQAFTMSADGLSSQAGDDKKLYYTNGGKLYEVALTQPALTGNGRQVSSETTVCSMIKVLPKDASANTSWLVLNTAGPDGACEYTDDNEVKLVSSDIGGSVPALVLTDKPRQVLRILDVQRDRLGNLANLIGYLADVEDTAPDKNGDVSTRYTKLTLISVAATGRPTLLKDLSAPSNENLPSISSFGKVAGSNTQIYLQLGNDIRVLSWDSGTPVLGSASVATLDAGPPSFLRTDARATYYVDGTTLKTLPASEGPKAPPTLPAGQEVQPGSAMTASALLLVLREGDAFSMQVFSKHSEVATTVAFGGSGALKVEAVNGDVAVVSQASASGEGGTLWRVDTSALSAAPIVPTQIAATSHARVITTVLGDTTTLPGETQGTHVVWCDASTACAPQNVSSYPLLGTAGLLLSPGNLGSASAWDNTTGGSRSTTLGLLSASSQTTKSLGDGTVVPLLLSDSVWLFDAAKAGSLSKVNVPASLPAN